MSRVPNHSLLCPKIVLLIKKKIRGGGAEAPKYQCMYTQASNPERAPSFQMVRMIFLVLWKCVYKQLATLIMSLLAYQNIQTFYTFALKNYLILILFQFFGMRRNVHWPYRLGFARIFAFG